MNLKDFFEEIGKTISDDTIEYINGLSEVDLKLLVKRVYENNDFIRNELNKQMKLTKYKTLQELISDLDKNETKRFIFWLIENIFGSKKAVEEELNNILSK